MEVRLFHSVSFYLWMKSMRNSYLVCCCVGQSMELKKCAEISGTGQAKILMVMKLQPPKIE